VGRPLGATALSKQRSRARSAAEAGAARAVRRLAGFLSPGAIEALARPTGALALRLTGRRRAILRFNLELAFGDRDQGWRIELERRIARHTVRAALHSMALFRVQPSELASRAAIDGRPHLEAVLGAGRGFFVLSAHLGLWEAAALHVGPLLPRGLTVVYRALDNPILDRDLENLRGRFGNRTVNRRGGAREMLREIRGDGAVGVLLDQREIAERGALVPFFGVPASTALGLAKMVRRTGAPVLPMWCVTEPRGRFRVVFEAPIPADAATDDVGLTGRYLEVTERAIRRHPEQWLWFHDRWRDRRLGRV
jgi:KDO2-lipid IV(A) lauroyltransferase